MKKNISLITNKAVEKSKTLSIKKIFRDTALSEKHSVLVLVAITGFKSAARDLEIKQYFMLELGTSVKQLSQFVNDLFLDAVGFLYRHFPAHTRPPRHLHFFIICTA